MQLHTWLIYFVAALGLSLSPGPNGLLALTHGALRGSWLAAHRLCRCGPWGAGGWDPVPPAAARRSHRTLSCHPAERS